MTYAVDPMRRAVFSHLTLPPSVSSALGHGVTWGGWVVPIGLELLVVMAIGLSMLGIAIAEFRRVE
jgi:ABC-2 type transport system permease protein